jgi:hypothetical protein
MIEQHMTAPNTGITLADVGIIATVAVTVTTAISFLVIRIFNLGKVSHRLETVERDIKSVKKDVGAARKDLTARIDNVLKSLALKQVSKSESPRSLNEFGKKVLRDSGVHSIIEPKLSEIVEQVKAHSPENPYQVQEMLIDIIGNLKTDSTLKNDVEQAAFKSGVAVDTVLLVGAIDIRDMVLAELGMTPEDIDKHKPTS